MMLTNKSRCKNQNCHVEIVTHFEPAVGNIQVDSPIVCPKCGWQSKPGRGLAGIALRSTVG